MKLAGVWNTGFGLLLVYGGVTGRFVLFGQFSPNITLVAGVLMTAWGLSQLWRDRPRK